MKLAGEYTFAAPRQLVWDALLDPTVLAAVLPGCERLEKVGDTEYEGRLAIKIGPIQGAFQGKVKLDQLNPPTSYTMDVDGRGAPGFVKAVARLTLSDAGDGTTMRYDADAQVGGKVASVGQRLIESSAKAIVKQSLDGLNTVIAARAAARTVQGAPPTASESARGGAPNEVPAMPTLPLPKAAPPSTVAFASSVAKEMAKDLVPPAARRVIVALTVVVLAILVYRAMF